MTSRFAFILCNLGEERTEQFQLNAAVSTVSLRLNWCYQFTIMPQPHDRSHDSSVGIALGYGLDDRSSMVRFPERTGNFSLHHRVRNGSGAHPASYLMGTRGSFPGGKAAGQPHHKLNLAQRTTVAYKLCKM
jgi:hypothetical protein